MSVSGLPGRSAGVFGAVRQVVSDGAWWRGRGHHRPGHHRGHVARHASGHARRRPAPAWQASHAGQRGTGGPRRRADHPGRAGALGAAQVLGSCRLSGNGLGIDRVLALAPALALAGIALLPLRALPAAARLLDRLSARSRRLAAALAGWRVSRLAVREGTAVLLVVLAVATGTLVLAQHQSWRQSPLDQAAFDAGADVRVGLATPLPLGRGAALAHAPGVRSAMPVSGASSGLDVVALDAAEQRAWCNCAPTCPPCRRPRSGSGSPRAPPSRAWRCRAGRPGWISAPGSRRRPGPGSARCRRACRCRTAGHRLRGPGRAPARRRPAPAIWSPTWPPPGRRALHFRLLGLWLQLQIQGVTLLGPGATATLAIRALAVLAARVR